MTPVAEQTTALIPLPKTVAPATADTQKIAVVAQAYSQALTYDGMTISSDLQYQEAGVALTYVKGTEEAVETLIKGLTKAYYDEWKAGNETKKPLIEKLTAIRKHLGAQMDAWEKSKEKEAERLAADVMPWEEPKEVLVTTPKVEGLTKKQGPIKVEITDRAAAVAWAINGHRDMLTIDEKLLKAYASSHEGLVTIPGVNVSRETIRARSGR